MTNKSEKEKNADYFISKGREYFDAKNYDLAIECFNKALLLQPPNKG